MKFLTDKDLDLLMTMDELMEDHLKRVFEATGYNKEKTSRVLKVSRSTIFRWLKEWNIERPEKKTKDPFLPRSLGREDSPFQEDPGEPNGPA